MKGLSVLFILHYASSLSVLLCKSDPGRDHILSGAEQLQPIGLLVVLCIERRSLGKKTVLTFSVITGDFYGHNASYAQMDIVLPI